MGVTLRNFEHSNLDGISGLRFSHYVRAEFSTFYGGPFQKVDEKFGKVYKKYEMDKHGRRSSYHKGRL